MRILQRGALLSPLSYTLSIPQSWSLFGNPTFYWDKIVALYKLLRPKITLKNIQVFGNFESKFRNANDVQ